MEGGQLKRGSFKEIIEIVIKNPITADIISGCIVHIFGRLLEKKEKSKCTINIEKLTNNINIVKNIENIILPLQTEKDMLIIYSPINKKIRTEVGNHEKDKIRKTLKKLDYMIIICFFALWTLNSLQS